MCVCEINDQLGMSQPAVSHHLKILKHAGIVNDLREGKWIYYSLNEAVFESIFQGEDMEVVKSFAEPIRQNKGKATTSRIRKDPDLCERLTAKQK